MEQVVGTVGCTLVSGQAKASKDGPPTRQQQRWAARMLEGAQHSSGVGGACQWTGGGHDCRVANRHPHSAAPSADAASGQPRPCSSSRSLDQDSHDVQPMPNGVHVTTMLCGLQSVPRPLQRCQLHYRVAQWGGGGW